MTKVKKKKIIPEVIPRESRDTKDYNEALRDGSWPREREWAEAIMDSNRRKGLKFKLDKLTRGRGNCFHISVLQQLNRRIVFDKLDNDEKKLAETTFENLTTFEKTKRKATWTAQTHCRPRRIRAPTSGESVDREKHVLSRFHCLAESTFVTSQNEAT